MSVLALALPLPVLLSAAPPEIVNARTTTRSASAGLATAVAAALRAEPGAQWIAYTVPIEPSHRSCCGDSWNGNGCCGGCRLEKGEGFSVERRPGPTRLEPAGSGLVLLRGERGSVGRIRFFSSDCPVDAGGLPVTLLTDVAPGESVRLLAGYAESGEEEAGRGVRDGALAAIAFHADPAADTWLLAAARRSASSHVRGQALFWLAHKAGRKAAGAITAAIEDDPDTGVKEKAVFALSQLPKDQGVPLLIDVARTNRNRQVREKAMFWLGQSNDPRALDFIEAVLTH